MLQGVTFHVKPRETVAFVGSTGSGQKEHNLVPESCRNYEIQKGEI